MATVKTFRRKKILPQLAVVHGRLRRLVGGRDHAHIDGDFMAAAQPAHLAVLDHAQQLRLQGCRHLRYFVEKQRAAVGQLETSHARSAGSGEGTFLVAEDLALDEAVGYGGGVDGDEGPLGARAQVVDRAGRQLLARPALPRDDDRRVGGAHAPDQFVDFAHGPAAAHEAAEASSLIELRQQPVRPAPQLDLLLGRLEDRPQLRVIERLGDEVVRAVLHGFDRDVDAPLGRDQNHRARFVVALEGTQQLQARDLRHDHVGENDVGIVGLDDLLRLHAVCRQADVESPSLEPHLEDLEHCGIVVDDKDLGSAQAHGYTISRSRLGRAGCAQAQIPENDIPATFDCEPESWKFSRLRAAPPQPKPSARLSVLIRPSACRPAPLHDPTAAARANNFRWAFFDLLRSCTCATPNLGGARRRAGDPFLARLSLPGSPFKVHPLQDRQEAIRFQADRCRRFRIMQGWTKPLRGSASPRLDLQTPEGFSSSIETGDPFPRQDVGVQATFTSERSLSRHPCVTECPSPARTDAPERILYVLAHSASFWHVLHVFFP